MKKIVSILKNKEIMNRLLFTLLILFIFRIGAQITVPGVKLGDDLNQYLSQNNALSLMNLLGGGTLQTFSIFALGVSPYITAQIIIQLLSTDVLPAMTELKRQGQYGRKKIEMATRYLTLLLGAVQAYGIIRTMENSDYITFVTADNEWLTYIYIVLVMMAGSMLVMWLGDQISVKGIGNGISMIIFAGIVSSLPRQISTAFSKWVLQTVGMGDNAQIAGVFQFVLYVVMYLLIISFVTFVELSQRKIPVQHSGKGGGQTQSMARASFLPIKINSAGVIPVIFASSLMMAPQVIVAFIDPNLSTAGWLDVFNTSKWVQMGGTGWYMPWGLIIYIVLTIAFTFFYANMQINPEQIAENFQKSGSYIPGIKPGNETERYVRKVLNRVTVIGALALAFIAALPPILTLSGAFGNDSSLALGGTGLIIVVGVALELNNQIDGLLAGKSFDEVVAGGGR
ncbi:MAG: preprotein translocase subunit SecY [Erysipelotrichaceae bacterium]|jgi:preprotein translocase subunit SecY|nr:preprotein translocase subunit SecY [Erysipelotrichaceae bacterium]